MITMRLLPALLILFFSAACERTVPSPGASGSAPSGSAAAAPAPLKPPTPDVLELLGNLRPGDKLGPLEVAAVGAPRSGRIPIEVRKGEALGLLEVALKGDGPLPPANSSKYAVFFASPRPGAPNLDKGSLLQGCEALATRLQASETKAPTPAGVATYGAVGQDL